MHRTTLFLAVLVLVTITAGVNAQNHPENFLLAGSSIQILQGNGNFNMIYNNPGSAHGVTSDLDNYNVIYAETDLYRVDPVTSLVTTLYPAGLGGSVNATIDHNGDYIMTGIGLGSSNYSIFRIRNNALTTIATMIPRSGTFSLTGGLLRDIDTGHFALQVYGGSAGPHPIISVAPDGTYTTIVTNISTLGGPRYEFTQDIRTGNFYTGINDTAPGLPGTGHQEQHHHRGCFQHRQVCLQHAGLGPRQRSRTPDRTRIHPEPLLHRPENLCDHQRGRERQLGLAPGH